MWYSSSKSGINLLACGVEVKIRLVCLTPVITAVNLPWVVTKNGDQIRWKHAMARKQAWYTGSKLPLLLCPIALGSRPNLILALDGCIVWNAHDTVFGSKR